MADPLGRVAHPSERLCFPSGGRVCVCVCVCAHAYTGTREQSSRAPTPQAFGRSTCKCEGHVHSWQLHLICFQFFISGLTFWSLGASAQRADL